MAPTQLSAKRRPLIGMEGHSQPWILGLSFSSHDSAACLAHGHAIEVAIAKERLSRIRHDGGWTRLSRSDGAWNLDECISYCRSAAGLSSGDVHLCVSNHVIGEQQTSETEQVVRTEVSPVRRHVAVSHHLAHAYSTYYASGFTDSLVLVVDGVGNNIRALRQCEGEDADYVRSREITATPESCEVLSAYSVVNGQFSVVRKDFGTESIGLAYRAVTGLLFANRRDAGKTMGLAPYGHAERCNIALIAVDPAGQLSYPYLRALALTDLPRRPLEWPAASVWTQDQQVLANLAARLQKETEDAVLTVVRALVRETGHRRLCVAGGVGLNSVLNGKLLHSRLFEKHYFFPAAGDDGVAIGCSFYGAAQSGCGRVPRRQLRSASLGRHYDDGAVATATMDPRLSVESLDEERVLERTVLGLAQDQVIGWFQGRSEFGPRALGQRSILANPARDGMKARLNQAVKFRESFRPFGPIVPIDDAHQYFECSEPSPFMLLAVKARPHTIAALPACVHVDGTARIQTVDEDTQPRLYRLLKMFGQIAGFPVLINTSLNLRGEPIVETPLDAVDCFLGCAIDALVIDTHWILKRAFDDEALLSLSVTVSSRLVLHEETEFTSGKPHLASAVAHLGENAERRVPLTPLQHLILRQVREKPLLTRDVATRIMVATGCQQSAVLHAVRILLQHNLCRPLGQHGELSQ